ncbi:MAG: SusC/RagA family TonB-linked outer membrane protein, partial [Bacteroidales bacterium]
MKRKLILLLFLSSLLIGSSFVYAQPDIPIDTITNMQASSSFGSEELSNTGAVTILDRKELQYNSGMDFTSYLEGNVPGVDISPVGGVPGAYVRILMRGVGSLNGGNDPLIILDGVPFENASVDAAGYRFSGLGEIDANDIESVYFLKDAAATAIYGSRAANGVIVINTITGTPNERNIEFSYRYGISDSPVKMDLLSADQFVNTLNQAYLNSYPDSSLPAPINLHAYDGFYSQEYTETLPDGSTIIHQPNLSSTNWYDNMMQNAVSQEVNIGWSGGDEKTQYYIGAGYKGDESLIFNGLYQRANARVNLHHRAGKRLSLGVRIYLVSNRRDINSKSWFETAHTTALPVYPVYSPNNPDYYWFNQSEPANIEALNEYSWNKSGGYRTFNVAYLDYRIFKGLSFHSQWSWDFQHYLHEDYKHPYVAPAENGLMIISRYDRSNWSTTNYLEYAGNPGDHAYNLRIGMSLENYSWDSNMIYNPGMTLIFVHSNGESNQNRLVGVYLDNSRFFSLYGSFDYAFRNKYFARLSLRSDASSRFGTGNRTHYFPAGSVAWDLSKEDFASNLSFLDYAKLRVGYGITGNALIGNFNHLSSLTEGNYDSPYVTTNGSYKYGDYPAVVPVNMANPSLGPEKSAQLNVGFDLGVFDNRISASLNYFNHTNTDQLNYVPLSILYGYENTNRWENAGELSVSGIEASISPVILRNEEGINWKTDIYVTSVKTVLESLPERVEYLEGYYNRSYPGDEVVGYYLAEYAGVDPETGH